MKEVLKDQIDMDKVEMFVVTIYYEHPTDESRGFIDMVVVREEKDLKILIEGLKNKSEYVVLNSRVLESDLTTRFELEPYKVEEVKIRAMQRVDDEIEQETE